MNILLEQIKNYAGVLSEEESDPEDIAKLLTKKLRSGDSLSDSFKLIVGDCFRNNNPKKYPIGNGEFLDLTKSENLKEFINTIFSFLPREFQTRSTLFALEHLKEIFCETIEKSTKYRFQ